jgi:hypothetical protein
MRRDMSKVIVERPRLGRVGARAGRTSALEDEEGAPLRARAPKIERPARTKSLNENLAPLRRFLEGQVGRPWNKVYSEISEHLKTSNTVQQHVRDHVDDFVAVNTRMERAKVMTVTRFGGAAPLEAAYQKLYVHPRTGLLRKNPHWRSWSAARKARVKEAQIARAARMREISPLVQLHLLSDGAWWEVKLAKIKTHGRVMTRADGTSRLQTFEEPHADVVLRPGLSDLTSADLYGRSDVYATEKRQLSKAEKKRLGLV